jgi:hypothetical protein
MCSDHRLAVGMLLIATACFDTEQIAIASRVSVDDFEDGDELANAKSGFGLWWCGTYPASKGQEETENFGGATGVAQGSACELSPGFESAYAESTTFVLHEMPGARPTGAILGVSAIAPTRDLSSFERISFRAKFDPGEPAPPDEARLLCELFCSSAGAEQDDMDSDVSVVYHGEIDEGVKLPGDWSTYSLPLAAFRQPFWQGQLYDEASCFSLVDSIRFRLDLKLAMVGQAAAGTLTIDDVELE